MIEQISLLTVDLIGHISCLLLCTALFRRTCAKRQLVLAFLGTLAAGYLITVVPVIREFPIKAILLVMVFTVFCHACYEGKILTQCLCAVFSYVIMLALDTAAIFLFCNWVGMPREQIFADPQLYMICALFSYIVIFVVSFAIWRFAQSWTKIEKISVSGFLAMLVFPLVSLGTITFLFQVTAKDHSVSHWAIVNALGLVAANAVLMGLRHRVGGHHAGSAIRCLINSSLIVLCGLFLYPQITAGWPVVGHSLVGMIACLVIGLAGPCNDPHIAMTPAELDRNRKRMMWELLVLAVAFSVLPLLPWGVWLSKTAAAAVTLAASMLIAGKIQNGGFTHEQE